MEATKVIVTDVYIVNDVTKEETRILGEMVFGRADVDKNYPDDTLISRRHFRLLPKVDAVLVEDLGSTNRTRVNGKLLKPSTLYKLKSRDMIEFGQQKIRIFVGGKIVSDATKLVQKSDNKQEAAEQSMVFERFVAAESANAPAAPSEPSTSSGLVLGADSMELDHNSPPAVETRKDDAVLQSMVTKKNAAWYLQFGGSEFGPLSLKELKVVIKSKQFHGGVLFAFTEGLADWLPVDKLMKFLDEPMPEFTATQRIAGGVPLPGKATLHVRSGAAQRFAGKLDTVSLSEITVTLRDPLLTEANLLELEAEPEADTGIEAFKATVKVDRARSLKNTHTLLFIQATPRTKMAIERFLRAKSG